MLDEYFNTYADPRVADWPLMHSFFPTAVITSLYVIMVRYGPGFMQLRKPFDLHIFVLCHNIFLVVLNVYSLWLMLGGALKAGYNFLCHPCLYSTDPGEMMIVKGVWWYYILRAVDLIDTLIHILRKKNAQLSFLHTYHHATMFPIWWVGTKFVAGGNGFFGPVVNSFVHIIMYTYYAIAEMGPEYRKYLWWKRYLTVVQMIQFLLVIGHSIQTIVTGCEQPLIFLYYCQAFYLFSLFILFLNFYFKQYKTKTTGSSEDISQKLKTG